MCKISSHFCFVFCWSNLYLSIRLDGGFDVFSDVSVIGECADFEFGNPQPFEGMMTLKHEGTFWSVLNKKLIWWTLFNHHFDIRFVLLIQKITFIGTDGYKGRYSKIYTDDNTDFKCYYVAFLDLEDSEAGQDCSIE